MKPRRAAAIVAAIALFGIADSRAAFAQEQQDIAFAPPLFAAASLTAEEARPFEIGPTVRPLARPAVRPQTRPTPLVGLYVSLAGMHALDVVSTQKALAAGATEANPMMAP